jgi:outer membrane lipoprotein-sorting protein
MSIRRSPDRSPRRHRPQAVAASLTPDHPSPVEAALRIAAALLVTAFALASVLLMMATTARAQALDVQEVLDRVRDSSRALQDVSFLIVGTLIDEAGQRIAVEIEVMALPGVPAASLYIVQPDALADNQVVIDAEAVRNYTFLTNQVSVFDADDPNALGGLFPEAANATIDLDLGRVFEGFRATLLEVEETGSGTQYVLRFDNLDPAAQIHHVVAVVVADDWMPRSLAFYHTETSLLGEIEFVDVVKDQGLTLADVTYLPEDAEVIDRRR